MPVSILLLFIRLFGYSFYTYFCCHVFHVYIRFCGKVWLKRTSTQSRRRCCQHGRFVADDSPITPLLPLPGEILDLLLTNQTHFSRTCALYNSILSLGATGVDNGRDVGWERIQGNHAGSRSLLSYLSKLQVFYSLFFSICLFTVCLNGRTYHFLPSVRPNSSTTKGGGLQYFIYDQCSQAIAHGQAKNVSTGSAAVRDARNIDSQYMECFYYLLNQHNPWHKRCTVLGDRLRTILSINEGDYDEDLEMDIDVDPNALIGNDSTPEMLAYMNEGEGAILDVASVTNINVTGERVIRYRLRDNRGSWTQIEGTSTHVEPLSYPLLFFNGEPGWGVDVHKSKVTFCSYICARLLMPERNFYARAEFPRFDSNGNEVLLHTNRFILLARLGQYWLCDSVSRAIDYSLSWHTRNQGYIFGYNSNALEEQQDENTAGSFGRDGHCEDADEINMLLENEDRQQRMEGEWGEHDERGDSGRSYRLEFEVEHREQEEGGGGGAEGGARAADGAVGGGVTDDDNDIRTHGILNQADHPDTAGFRVESKANFLSDTHHGSRRHLRKLATNALVIVTARDTPHLFITFTCNKDWPEITSRLLKGTEAFDNPALTAEVFHFKVQTLLHNLRTGKYFRDDASQSHSIHRVAYHMYVVEYQHRGLPHAHIVCRLTNMPPKDQPEEMLSWIQRHIRTVMPREGENVHCYASSMYSLQARREMVDKKMRHTCYPAKKTNSGDGEAAVEPSAHATCKDKNNICKKGFDHTVLNDNKPSFDAKGYPTYGRLKLEDLNIVSYEMGMLMDANCHCNVEFCGSSYTCVYLYKYIFKGAKKEKLRLKNADDLHDKDELNLYLRARMISSMDAAWRVMGYHTYPATNPSVTLVKVKTPEQQATYTDNIDPKHEKKLTDLYVYFHRPQNIVFNTTNYPALEQDHQGKNMDDLKYTEFFDLYTYDKRLPEWHKNRPDMNGIKWWQIEYPNKLKTYVFKRQDPHRNIVRMQMLYPNIGELYWIRTLLLNRPSRSFEALRTSPGNVRHALFQECAQELGLASEEAEATMCFSDAMVDSTPRELRSLFISLTVEGFPTLQIFNSVPMRAAMMLDFSRAYTAEQNSNGALPMNDLLKDFADRLLDLGKCLTTYGLPLPDTIFTELEQERARYSIDTQTRLLQHLNETAPNNTNQQSIYDRVVRAVNNGESLFLYCQGPAGSGKTTLAKKIMAYVRSLGN